jgi:23S rRNA (adenine2030-N6)-methyltransferase
MFSYRHAFHAGNHADVLKHLVLIHSIRYLQEKDGGLMLIDTHAGAGLYALREGYATVSQEALTGIDRIIGNQDPQTYYSELQAYIDLVNGINPPDRINFYPGSPFILAKLLRAQDRLRLFELHSSDIDLLQQNIKSLHLDRQIEVRKEDGFAGLKSLLPPPSRRGLILIDPSYENKQDYFSLETCLAEALERFVTGSYLMWYPILNRNESLQLPKRLKAIAERYGRSWTQAELRITNEPTERRLQASGMLVINPVWTLKAYLEKLLPILQNTLGEDAGASYQLLSNQT